MSSLPTIIVTGASGIVGRRFLDLAKESYTILALARRSQSQSEVAAHPNIRWIQVDIANWTALKAVMGRIRELGGADYILHLAAYYDFDYVSHPEYTRTNVHGTRHMLELAKGLGVKRFIFASSLIACRFPTPGKALTEKSPVDADIPYGRSKSLGEALVRQYSQWLACSTVRIAAVFSDWCEYAPLYMLLSTWLSRSWNARVLGGKGESAVCYIHVKDLCQLFLTILRRSGELPSYDVYCASPDGSTSHRELYDLATRYYFGQTRRPILLPKVIALPGVAARDLLGRLIGRRPFERTWMMKYLDQKLDIDASYTRKALDWQPTPRNHLRRRLLFLIEKMKARPWEWVCKNEAAAKREILRPNLRIYEALHAMQQQLTAEIMAHILAAERWGQFLHYHRMDRTELEWYVGLALRWLSATVRTADRTLMMEYFDDLAHRRFEEGFDSAEITDVLQAISHIVVSELLAAPELRGMEQEVHGLVALTLQLTVDEIEDIYEELASKAPPGRRLAGERPRKVPAGDKLEKFLASLETFYQPSPDEEDGSRAEEPVHPVPERVGIPK